MGLPCVYINVYATHENEMPLLLGKEPAQRGNTTNGDDKRVARRIMSLRLCECVEMTRADVVAWTRGVTHTGT